MATAPYASDNADGQLLRIKVIPGSSRERVAGMLGDRLKVQVQAPPEGGKANKAVIAVLAKWISCRRADLSIASGHTQPLKTVLYTGSDSLPDIPGFGRRP